MAFGDAVSPRRLMCASALNADEAPFVVKKRNADSAFAHASGVSVPSSRGRACHGGGRRPSELKASSLIFPKRAFFFVFSVSLALVTTNSYLSLSPAPPALGLFLYRPASRHRGVNWLAATGRRSGRSLLRLSFSYFPRVSPLSSLTVAAVSHESNESLCSLLAAAASSLHSNPAAFVPSSISASVPLLPLFPVPLE